MRSRGRRRLTPENILELEGLASIGKTFRGTIWENCKRFKLSGTAYASMPPEQGGHFCIESAMHLKGILEALLDPNVRKVFIIGATQVMKSVIGDIWLPFIMEHFPRNLIVYFEDEPKAQLFCDARLMPTVKEHPELSKMIQVLPNRHDSTKTRIKLPTMLLEVCGLNDGNASSLSWPYIWISEAWQHFSDGLLAKAIKRADRFPDDCKILCESQAGDEGEDLERQVKTAHPVPLTWACPHCQGRQTWEFSQLRPEDFPAKDLAKPGTFSGMTFDSDDSLTIAQRARTATWECYHCGQKIIDGPEMRKRIAETYEQDYKITDKNGLRFSPKDVAFFLPKEAAWNNTFEESSKSFLVAKDAQRMGNLTPIADWYKSERAKFWNPKLIQAKVSTITATTDNLNNPNEAMRCIGIDCQQGEVQFRTGKFWYLARSIDKTGKEISQLARGYAESWKDWIDAQKRLKIPAANVGIDGGNYLDEILDAVAANVEWVESTIRGKKFWVAKMWKVFVGNGLKSSFPHDDKVTRSYSKPSYHRRVVTFQGKQQAIGIPVYNWSNLSVKDHLARLRSGGVGLPTFTKIAREKLPLNVQLKEVGGLAYDEQMDSEYRGRSRGRDTWIENNPNVHYRDCECECLILMDMGGMLGVPPAPDETQTV